MNKFPKSKQVLLDAASVLQIERDKIAERKVEAWQDQKIALGKVMGLDTAISYLRGKVEKE